MALWEKFGEMGSYEEINELASALYGESDYDSIKILAKENGIASDYVTAYIHGDMPALCDALIAALGKLEVECKELKPQEIMMDWVEYIRGQCLEDEKVALAVRKVGKRLEDCIAELLKWSFAHQQAIDAKIVKAAGIKASKVTLGIPGYGTAKKIIREYYLGGDKK